MTAKLLLFLLVNVLITCIASLERVQPDPDVGKDMVTLVTDRGYPSIETHFVTTSDNYILTIFRIPSKNSKNYPVILQHGLLDSSYAWIANMNHQSLGYILADNGFDVWFGNNRGNKYGRNHTTYDPNDKSTSNFWDFSWDEMAMIDVPCIINYILDETKATKINWVGHSEGTLQMFAAGSSMIEKSSDSFFQRAVKSVNLFIALAPVVYVKNILAKPLIALANTKIGQILYAKGIYEFLPDGRVDSVAPEICQAVERICDVFLMTICGPTYNINASRIQVYVSNTPAGTSTRNMIHWQQGILNPTFQKFDYGNSIENILHYGTKTAPLYNLSQYTIPTALFIGDHDYLAESVDVETMLSEIPKDSIVFKKEIKSFAHLDFTWGVDANVYVYKDVVKLLREYV